MLLRPALLVVALAASSLALGEALDVTGRIARLSYVEGKVTFQSAKVTFQSSGKSSPSALPDRPLMPGDRLSTGRDGRAELAFGTAVTRLDQDTELTLVHLDAATVRMQLTAGTASLHLRELLENETFEIVTPNATLAFQQPGEYRVDVAADGATELTVRTGAADVATADAFDDWVLERELQLAQAEPPAREQPDGYYEDGALDRYGEWYDEPSYGRVWMPSYAYGGYDPFRYGRWERVGFGWSWYDSMPWSAHTFHSGRWAYLDHLNRWCWVPSRRDHRRHVAQDTRPYGRPRNDDRPRHANPRRDNEEPRPAATSAALPLRLGADRPTVFGRAAEQPAKPTRRQAPTPAPRTNSNPSPPPQSAPAASTGTTTMRPAQAAKAASSPAPSTPVSSNKSREFGTIQPP